MTVLTLLEGLRKRGAEVCADGADLEIKAPPGVLQPRLLAAIRDHKAALLRLLQGSTPAGATPEYSRFDAGAAYDPKAARDLADSDLADSDLADSDLADSDQTLTPEQRETLLACADEIEKERAQTTARMEMAA